MLRYKKMWFVLCILVVLGVVWGMVLSRKINPDHFFVQKLEPIPFTQIYVNDYIGSLQIAPEIGDTYRTTVTGKRYYIGNIYSLYDEEYSFSIDKSNQFVLTQLSNNRSFVLGKVVDKTFQEYNGTDIYTIELPNGYMGSHQFKKGRLPFYEKVNLTMMSSGGFKYSSHTCTTIQSPVGDTLVLSQNFGYLPVEKPTGIYN